MEIFDLLKWLISMLVGGGAVYAGIRADLARITVKAEMAAAAAQEAHQRIDALLMQGHARR